jgi:hypothetical protein
VTQATGNLKLFFPGSARIGGAASTSSSLTHSSRISVILHILGISGGDLSQSLTEILSRLSSEKRDQLQNDWGKTFSDMEFLTRERDPQLFYEGLMNLGMQMEGRDQLSQATAVYSAILEASAEKALRTLAQDRLDTIHGVGSSSARLEFLTRRFAKEASSPSALFAMGAAGAAFRLAKLATMSRLAMLPGAGIFCSGFGLKLTGNMAGFIAETLAFTAVGKGIRTAVGVKEDWSGRVLASEWFAGALMLGGLKLTGDLMNAAAKRWVQGESKLANVSRAAMPQLGMLSGIMLGNKLSEVAESQKPRDRATMLVDSLETLLQFNISGRLLHGAMGEGLRRWEQKTNLQTEALVHAKGHFVSPHSRYASPFLSRMWRILGPDTFIMSSPGGDKQGEIRGEVGGGPLQKRRYVLTESERVWAAFKEAIRRAEANQETFAYRNIADLALQIYSEGLPEAKRPAQGAFRTYVGGKNKDAKIIALLENSNAVQKRRYIRVDGPRLRAAFEEATQRIKASAKIFNYQRVSDLAYKLYLKGLPQEQWPARATFWHYINKDPEIIALLESSKGITKRRKIKVDVSRCQVAFEEAIQRLEKNRETVAYRQVADLAHQIYSEGLSEAKRPVQYTFRSFVSGKNKDAKIIALLENSAAVEKQERANIHESRLFAAFKEAMRRVKKGRVVRTPTEVAGIAHQIYIKGMTGEEKPSPITFRYRVHDLDIAELLENSRWVVRQERTKIDKSMCDAAFKEAIKRVEKRKETVTFQQVADLALKIYSKGMTEKEKPSPVTFRNYVNGPKKEPKIIALLESSPVVEKRKRIMSDVSKRYVSFQEAIRKVEEIGEEVNFQQVADLAHRIYSEGLAENEKPSPITFRNQVSGPRQDLKIVELLENSRWVKKHRIL